MGLVICMGKVVVIGGGAAGLASAIVSARTGSSVVILERNTSCCKKLLITGNGKCNYWNSNQDIIHYHSMNRDILSKIITDKNKEAVLTFFDSIGIVPKIKEGYYYPYSSLAASIQYALLREAEVLGVQIVNEVMVENIVKKDNSFTITTNKNKITCDKVILATGSKACPKTGSDGSGYHLAMSLGHSIVDVEPALVQLEGRESYFKLWSGIRTQANLTLSINHDCIKEEAGEVQLTEYGISGICVFNLSRYVARALKENKNVFVTINFAPWFQGGIEDFVMWMNERNQTLKKRRAYELFEGFLHYKLVDVLFKKMGIDKNISWESLSFEEQKKFSKLVLAFHLSITGTCSFDKAQVCCGGVSLDQISPETMESNIVKGLYIVGELLDVDGDCGGYNLGFAWMSGILAGNGVSND